MSIFKYDLHYEHQGANIVTPKGVTDFNNFNNELIKFPWIQQLKKKFNK